MSDEKNEAPAAPEQFAASVPKPGVAPTALDTTATGHSGGPCTVLHLYQWLSDHIVKNPGVFTNDVVVTTATTISITPA